ncbi:hypothetical protein [Oscillibacter sp. CU971]|uniref:hypothetical protein n=1 Tax=Oscillibacter sp. CU971 TaxID=2780102 RepID=UPI00195704FC|nr:hypothetical protein [Oscillibacter sp. CU971]
MMLSEFVERTGFEPMPAEYAKIEEAYCGFNGDKDAFCKAFVAGDGEKKIYQARAAVIDRLNGKILELDKTIQRSGAEHERQLSALQAELDKELEWKPYEFTQNIPQVEYAELAKCVVSGSARYMTDDEALDWVCREFGFDHSQVTILHEIDEQEINRHNLCRASGRKIDRRPVYCATDYHYIRFNAGCGAWQWEVWNGQIRPFYD